MAPSSEKRSEWTVEVANRHHRRRLIDERTAWIDNRLLKESIEGSDRLERLRTQKTSNRITSLPDRKALVRQFYCVNCKLIPFPWASTPERPLKTSLYNPDIAIEDNIVPEGVYLCENGHPTCRTCYQFFTVCMMSQEDCDYIFKDHNDKDLAKMEEEENIQETGAGSLGIWGQGTKYCMAKFSPFMDDFLALMIYDTKFCCRNYYNWCEFRGRGEKLMKHERKCPMEPKKNEVPENPIMSSMFKKVEEVKDDLKEEDILDLETLKKEASQMVTEIRKLILQ